MMLKRDRDKNDYRETKDSQTDTQSNHKETNIDQKQTKMTKTVQNYPKETKYIQTYTQNDQRNNHKMTKKKIQKRPE